MEFRTAHQDKWDNEVIIGSRTYHEFAYHAYQTCNFLNMLYRNIHYSDNMPTYSSGSSMVISVVSHNLKYELSRLEKIKAEYDQDFKKDYRYYFDAVIEELANIKKLLVYPTITMIDSDYIKDIKDLCDNLMLKGFEALSKTYPEHGFYINNE